MPIDSAEKRPYYVLIETNNALEGKTMNKPTTLNNGIQVAHLEIYPSRRGATGMCKSVRHWCFCVILSNGKKHTDQGYASKKEAREFIERFSPDWVA